MPPPAAAAIQKIALILLIGVALGQNWESTVQVYQSDKVLCFQKHFVDKSDLSKHFLFGEAEKYEDDPLISHSLYYIKLSKNGTLGKPVLIARGILYMQSDIIGAGDGKQISIAVCLGWKNMDVYFTESLDGGETWSSLSRIQHDSDGRQRFSPSMGYDETTGRMYIFYFSSYVVNNAEDGFICSVTRPPGSRVFRYETTEFATLVQKESAISYKMYRLEAKVWHNVALIGEKGSLTYHWSYEPGKWTHTTCTQEVTNCVLRTPALAVYGRDPSSVCMLSQTKNRNEAKVLFSSDRYVNCGQPRAISVPSSIDYVSNEICKFESDSYDLLAYATGTSTSNTDGFLLRVKYLDEKDYRLAQRPFSGIDHTSIFYPDLHCRYIRNEGSVSVSAIVKNLAVYRIYVSDAMISNVWM